MIYLIKKSSALAFAVISVIFTFVPETFFGSHEWISQDLLKQYKIFSDLEANDVNVIISRLACFFLVWMATLLVYTLFLVLRRSIAIRGENYSIQVEYDNILQKKDC